MLGLRRVAFSSLFRARLVAQHPLARHDCRAPEPLPSPAHSPQSPLFPTELARACALPASPSRDLRIEFAPQAAGLSPLVFFFLSPLIQISELMSELPDDEIQDLYAWVDTGECAAGLHPHVLCAAGTCAAGTPRIRSCPTHSPCFLHGLDIGQCHSRGRRETLPVTSATVRARRLHALTLCCRLCVCSLLRCRVQTNIQGRAAAHWRMNGARAHSRRFVQAC